MGKDFPKPAREIWSNLIIKNGGTVINDDPDKNTIILIHSSVAEKPDIYDILRSQLKWNSYAKVLRLDYISDCLNSDSIVDSMPYTVGNRRSESPIQKVGEKDTEIPGLRSTVFVRLHPTESMNDKLQREFSQLSDLYGKTGQEPWRQ